VQQDGPVSPERCQRVLRDVAEALAYAHARGVVHRDVKPENIFIDEESDRALLSDFGIARSAEQESMTLTGTAIGTPFYMSPEQIDNAAIDGRSDLYSLGLVAWEMLSGRRAWDGASLYALLYHQKHDYLPDIREMRNDVDDRFADVIATAIEKDPDLRWQSVDEMIAALDRVIPSRRAGVKPYVTSDTVQVSRATLAPIIQPAANRVSPTPLEIVEPVRATEAMAGARQPVADVQPDAVVAIGARVAAHDREETGVSIGDVWLAHNEGRADQQAFIVDHADAGRRVVGDLDVDGMLMSGGGVMQELSVGASRQPRGVAIVSARRRRALATTHAGSAGAGADDAF
jgi:hypothetical protein